MVDFFIEGGWGMWPVLIFSLLMLGASAVYAARPVTPRLRFIAAMGTLLTVAFLHAMLTNVAVVFAALADAPADQRTAILFAGLKESTRPGIMGGAFLVLSLVLVAVGVYRAGRRELAAT